jgi:hypothetical protein
MKTEDLHKPAIPVAYGHLILTVADKLGVGRAHMLDGLNIPDTVFASADARLSMLQANNLLYRGLKLTGNPGFGYEIGLHSGLTTHGFIGFGLLSNATLRTAADFGSRYLALRLPNLSLRVFTDGAQGVIEVNETLALGAVRQCMYDLFLVGLWRMAPNSRMHAPRSSCGSTIRSRTTRSATARNCRRCALPPAPTSCASRRTTLTCR